MTASEKTRRGNLAALAVEVPAVLVTFAMMLHVTANAVMRTWWNNPITHTLEFVQYWYLPIVAFLGFVAAQQRGQHIAADLVFEALPEVAKRFVLALVLLVCSAVSAGFAWFGWGEAVHTMEIRKVAGVSSLPAWPTYFLVPLAFGSLTLQLAWASIRALRHDLGEVASDVDPVMPETPMASEGGAR